MGQFITPERTAAVPPVVPGAPAGARAAAHAGVGGSARGFGLAAAHAQADAAVHARVARMRQLRWELGELERPDSDGSESAASASASEVSADLLSATPFHHDAPARHAEMTQIPGMRLTTSAVQGHGVDEPEALAEATFNSLTGRNQHNPYVAAHSAEELPSTETGSCERRDMAQEPEESSTLRSSQVQAPPEDPSTAPRPPQADERSD